MTTQTRLDGRALNELRKIKITPNVAEYAEGSALVEFGATRVLCTASFEAQGPKWLQGTGQGWITAEYGMLPRSTQTRIKREKAATSGRTQEIARLIGRSLRAGVDLKKIGESQITVDCDVINADGGTRTASVTGGFVALALAIKKLHDFKLIPNMALTQYVSAVSVGLLNNNLYLDLNYEEDSRIGTDMNVVVTSSGLLVEVQGTAEHSPFSKQQLNSMVELAESGCQKLFAAQSELIGSFLKL